MSLESNGQSQEDLLSRTLSGEEPERELWGAGLGNRVLTQGRLLSTIISLLQVWSAASWDLPQYPFLEHPHTQAATILGFPTTGLPTRPG